MSKKIVQQALVKFCLMAVLGVQMQHADAVEPVDCKNIKRDSQVKRGADVLADIGAGLFNLGLNKIGVKPENSTKRSVKALLSESIACALTENEQTLAQTSSAKALNKGVGGTSTWVSKDRPDVSGSTTITAQTQTASGELCRTAKTVATVNGEEITTDQSYCMVKGGPWVAKV